MVLLANESIHQARGAPFWVDETHQFELLGERGMLADLEQHIGHDVDITLQLEWESKPGPQPIPEPTTPGAGFPGSLAAAEAVARLAVSPETAALDLVVNPGTLADRHRVASDSRERRRSAGRCALPPFPAS
jgi:hypothetical protein